MDIQLFSVRDTVARAFGNPFTAGSYDLAKRILAMQVNHDAPDNVLNSNPADFELYCVGSFDTETGLVSILPAPVSIVSCADLVRF